MTPYEIDYWENICNAYKSIVEGKTTKIETMLGGFKATVYKVGEKVIRIDIKRGGLINDHLAQDDRVT